MKMQPIRVGVASIIAATMIGAGVSAQTAGAAPVVKTNSNVHTFAFNQDAINQIANKYGIDLSNIDLGKILFNGCTITLPST
ncbi:SCP-like extracellular, partial [Paenibacillus sp. MCAF20]